MKEYKLVPPPLKIYNEFLMEFETLKGLEKWVRKKGIEVRMLTIQEFLTSNEGNINLLFEGSVERFLYDDNWDPPLQVDGKALLTIVGDKYETYKKIMNGKIPTPNTFAIRGQKDLLQALEQIQTEKIVLKPRFWSYASANVLILKKHRLLDFSIEERFNVKDFVLQEYLPSTLFPSVEWRFHFVGNTLCRVIKTKDKNNWSKSFHVQNIDLEQVENRYINLAKSIAALINPKNYPDNFTLDFLETETGLIFLEANVGTLNSMFVHDEKDFTFIEPIFEELVNLQKNTISSPS